MGRDLDEGLRRRGPGHGPHRVGREDDLRHEDIPGLAVLRAWIHVLVLAVPDCVRSSGPAGLDPGEHVHRVTRRSRTVAHLHWRRPAFPSAGRARRADKDLTLAWVGRVASQAPDHKEIAGAV